MAQKHRAGRGYPLPAPFWMVDRFACAPHANLSHCWHSVRATGPLASRCVAEEPDGTRSAAAAPDVAEVADSAAPAATAGTFPVAAVPVAAIAPAPEASAAPADAIRSGAASRSVEDGTRGFQAAGFDSPAAERCDFPPADCPVPRTSAVVYSASSSPADCRCYPVARKV